MCNAKRAPSATLPRPLGLRNLRSAATAPAAIGKAVPRPKRASRASAEASGRAPAIFAAEAAQMLAKQRLEAGHEPLTGQMLSLLRSRSRRSPQKRESARQHLPAADPRAGPAMDNQMDLIKTASRVHHWHWNEADKSHECIVSPDKLEVCFHPECSESAAAIRGSEPLTRNGNYYYWEIKVYDKTYGTSVMFGLCTANQQLHANDYCNLVGLDRNGWSLSHKGSIWHAGKQAQYTRMFPANQTITLGLLFNTMRGELSYFINGENLGVAFCGLNDVKSELYPVIGSTAKCTRMRLLGTFCGYMSLAERSCFCLLKNAKSRLELIETMQQNRIPRILIKYMAETAQICETRPT